MNIKFSHLWLAVAFSVSHLSAAEKGNGDANSSATGSPFVIRGIINEHAVNGGWKLGPFRLREDADDWTKELGEASGAKFSYSNDREAKEHQWSAKGALIYPIQKEWECKNLGGIFSAIPAAEWNVVDIAGSQTNDVQELKFQVPAALKINHDSVTFVHTEIILSSYYQTDFGFKGGIEGISLGFLPTIQIDGSPGIYINSIYRSILHDSWFQYRIGLKPALDFNHLSSTSRYIERTGDEDYFRLDTAFEFGLLIGRPMDRESPSLELLASYRCFTGLAGGPSYSDLLTLKATLWLNRHAGFTAEFTQGQTPVAQKDIDLFTVGLELKF